MQIYDIIDLSQKNKVVLCEKLTKTFAEKRFFFVSRIKGERNRGKDFGKRDILCNFAKN